MGVANLTSSGGGLASAVKSVQRGEAVSAGTITISSVDTTKSQVTSFSTGSTGTVAATGAVGATTGNMVYSFWGDISNQQSYIGGNGVVSVYTSTIKPANIPYENYFNGPFAQYGGRYGQTLNAYYYSYATTTNSLQGINLNATNITGGTTSLTSASYGAYLSNATSLVVTGPCRYEVVEYY